MHWLWKLICALGRGVFGLVVFFVLSIAWIGVLFLVNPWMASSHWKHQHPIIVGNTATGVTRVVLYPVFENEKNSALVPWPLVPSGTGREGWVRTAWKTVDGHAWQFEARWDDGDYILESRYRVDGRTPVLVESRGRDPGLGLIGMALAVITLLLWKAVRWWRRRVQTS